MATTSTNSGCGSFSINLSPPRAPSPKNVSKPRKKPEAKPDTTAPAKPTEILYNQLMKDPEKKCMVLKLLQDNQSIIQKYMPKEKAPPVASPVKKIMNPLRFESPTALVRRRQLEAARKLQAAAARDAEQLEKKLTNLAVTPSRKPVRKTLLKDVYAFVEVKDSHHVDKSEGVKQLLQKMGGTVAPKLTHNCTHVIYKDGTYDTFKKAKQMKIPVVSLLWLDVIDRTGFRVSHDVYPALGDHKSKETCDQICEKLNSNDKRRTLNATKSSETNTSRRQTLLPSQTFCLDENCLQMSDEPEDPDIIESSQPEPSTTRLNFTKLNKTQALPTIEDDSKSDASDAPSNEPLICGLPSRRTNFELEQSEILNNSLLNSPHINKAKRGRPRKSSIKDKDNLMQSPTTSSSILYNNVTKRRAKTPSCNIGVTPEITKIIEENNDDSGNDTGKMSPTEASTPISTKPRRRTLLPPEALGIVNETDDNTLFMELTLGKSTSKKRSAKSKQRATDHVPESMEMTNVIDMENENEISKISKRTPVNATATSTFTVNKSRRMTRQSFVDTLIKSPDKTLIKDKLKDDKFSTTKKVSPKAVKLTSFPKVKDNDDIILNASKKTTRTSTSSTRTSASEDLMTVTSRRVTRRMTMFAKTNISGTEEMCPLQITNDSVNIVNKSKSKTSSGAEEMSLNIQRKSTSSGVPSLRLSTEIEHINESSSNDKNINLEKQPVSMETEHEHANTNCKDLPAVHTEGNLEVKNVSKKIDQEESSITSPSNGPSLRLSTSSETHQNPPQNEDVVDTAMDSSLEMVDQSADQSNESNLSSIPGDLSKNSKSEEEVNEKKVVSPVSILSKQLAETSIVQPSRYPMESNTIETASTSYSIVDASVTTAGDASTRLGSSGPSKISNITTSRSTSTATTRSGSNQTGSTTTTTNKRKLCNPDDVISENDNDVDEDRRFHTQQTQDKINSTRKTLKTRLDRLDIPNMISKNADDESNGMWDNDFWDPVALTQRTQRGLIQTQRTQTKQIKSIVCTRFHSEQIAEFKEIVSELGEFRIEQDVTAKTTHVVSMEASRTLNMIRAMSRGLWILRSDWLFDSRKAGKWLDEDDYEMTEFSQFVQEFRLQRESFGKAFCHDVFINCGPIYVAPNCHPSQKDLQDLITLCKGNLAEDVEDASIVIGKVDREENESQTCVREVWILDSITFGRCKRFKNYLH